MTQKTYRTRYRKHHTSINKKKKKQNETQEKQAKEFSVPDALRDAWLPYCAMRAQKGRPMTETDAQNALNRLEALAPGNPNMQRIILTQSTMYRIDKLYPLGKIDFNA